MQIHTSAKYDEIIGSRCHIKTGGSFWMMINAYIHNKWCLEFRENQNIMISKLKLLQEFMFTASTIVLGWCISQVVYFGYFGFVFLVIFVALYHGTSPWRTTIRENMFGTCSKHLKQIQDCPGYPVHVPISASRTLPQCCARKFTFTRPSWNPVEPPFLWQQTAFAVRERSLNQLKFKRVG